MTSLIAFAYIFYAVIFLILDFVRYVMFTSKNVIVLSLALAIPTYY